MTSSTGANSASRPEAKTRPHRWAIYGAYGYTGQLIAERACEAGHRPLLVGRDVAQLGALADKLGLPHRAIDLGSPDGASDLADLAASVSVLVNCAGPFIHTWKPIADACLRARTHMLDITGEWPVIDGVLRLANQAREAGVCLLPASGWDVVTSDCLLAHCAEQVEKPDRAELLIAFGGKASRGTSLSVVESLGARPSRWHDGDFVPVPAGERRRNCLVGRAHLRGHAISWGDIASAPRSTGARIVTTYAAMPRGAGPFIAFTELLGRTTPTRTALRKLGGWVAQRAPGSNPDQRARARCLLWAQVTGNDGSQASATLATGDGYELTANAVCAVVDRVLNGQVAPGAWTPSQAHGTDFVLGLPGVTRN